MVENTQAARLKRLERSIRLRLDFRSSLTRALNSAPAALQIVVAATTAYALAHFLLGHPPRRLVLLHLDGSEGQLPVAGDEVSLGDKVVGRVTTVALHYELGPIALAVVKRSVDPTAELIVVTGALAGSVGADSDADSDAGSDSDSDAGSDAGSGDDDGNGNGNGNGTVSAGIRIAASQEVIVPTDAGAAVNVPRLPRLGAVTR